MARVAKKSGTYHHGDLRRVLLEAAVHVVDKEGVGALSLQAIARRAGVSSGAPYHHFASREDLLAAIALEGFQLLTAAMREGADQAVPFKGEPAGLARLRGLGHGYVRFALGHPGHFRIMFRPEFKAKLREAQEPLVDEGMVMLGEAIALCQAEGSIAQGDAKGLVLLAWSAVHGASTLWIDGPLATEGLVGSEEELGAAVADGLVGLLGARR